MDMNTIVERVKILESKGYKVQGEKEVYGIDRYVHEGFVYTNLDGSCFVGVLLQREEKQPVPDEAVYLESFPVSGLFDNCVIM